MATSAQDAYLESRVLSANPVELIEILYEAALESVERARRHLREGDITARSKAISRACAILVELSLAVKHDAGTPISRNLVELYDYMQRRLIEANVQQVDPPLAEVSRLMGTLIEGWASSRRVAAGPVEIPRIPLEQRGNYVRQNWTA